MTCTYTGDKYLQRQRSVRIWTINLVTIQSAPHLNNLFKEMTAESWS